VVGACPGVGNGEDRQVATDIGSHRVAGDHRARETRIVSRLQGDVTGTVDVAIDLSGPIGVGLASRRQAPFRSEQRTFQIGGWSSLSRRSNSAMAAASGGSISLSSRSSRSAAQ
jgi:hypothetical protein